ncbi:MAG: ATP-binding cassette domain-containing protein [Spirochaetaceae bacterium]|nr:ATP-binding cassette domain-containing protein [Spirochaetaceae bacterium]
MELPAIEVVHVSKFYKDESIIANDDLTLKFNKGEITCIAGENGAGKSTLMKIIFGMETPSKGEIFVNGKKVEITHPLIAQALGIGMVHQKFKLFNNLSISENVSLGVELKKHFFFLDNLKTLRKVQELINSHNIQLQADTKIKDLSTGEKQLVEILKMLYRNADILIFDEPTAVLTEQEAQQLFATMRELKAQNKCVIVITHKVQEILDIADIVSIMRKGKLIGTYKRSELNGKTLSDLIMGEEVKSINVEKKHINYSQLKPVISFKDVCIYRENQEKPLLYNINFNTHPGEIIGFCGVSGNGMGILEAVLGGMMPISSGHIYLKGEEITNLSPDKLRSNGLAFVPADRYQYGSAANATLAENLIINHRDRLKKMNEFAKPLIDKYNINGMPSQKMKTLSGGNIQKAIVAREIENMKDYIILSNPTWGMDLAATAYIHSQILELKEKGASIILLSSNVDEVLLLSDTIDVVTGGEIKKSFKSSKKLNKLLIGEYMLGRKS